jgi:hypothetical protein
MLQSLENQAFFSTEKHQIIENQAFFSTEKLPKRNRKEN